MESAMMVGVVLSGSTPEDIDEQLDELELLADTAGAQVLDRVTQRRNAVDPATFIGKGKINEIIGQAEELECNLILFNDEISPTQIKNIQKLAGEEIKVLDRTGLILDIFRKHARTREAKTQVELAQLQYLLPRLTRLWTHLERQMGGIGTRAGAGETQIEIDRRLIQTQISRLKKDLIRIDKQRETQSHNRRDEFRVALVGYTNAGKSTIMRALTGAEIYVQDQLFATLDTTVRKVEEDNGPGFLLSDTVGFIRKLPHDLVASFRSTLKEAAVSHLILKVLDASSPQRDIHLSTINDVLQQLDLSDIPAIVVLNKVDQISDKGLITRLGKEFPESVFISALRGLKLDVLNDRIHEKLKADHLRTILHIPYTKSGLLNQIYQSMKIHSREDGDTAVQLEVEGRCKDINSIQSQLSD